MTFQEAMEHLVDDQSVYARRDAWEPREMVWWRGGLHCTRRVNRGIRALADGPYCPEMVCDEDIFATDWRIGGVDG